MECACFTADSDDYAKTLEAKIRTARKTHRCSECRGTIFPGQQYHYESYLIDGSVEAYKTCMCCHSVRENLVCSYTLGELWDDVRSHLYGAAHYTVDGIPWALIARLTPAARAHVLLIIEKIWSDAGCA